MEDEASRIRTRIRARTRRRVGLGRCPPAATRGAARPAMREARGRGTWTATRGSAREAPGRPPRGQRLLRPAGEVAERFEETFAGFPPRGVSL